VAHRQDDDEDERDDDTQDDQLDLHVLQPHLSPHLGALLPEILCLQTACLGSHKKQLQVCSLAYIQIGNRKLMAVNRAVRYYSSAEHLYYS
jgi:hypothetical protein